MIEEADYSKVIIENKPFLVNLARKYVGSGDAEDVVQAAYIKVWEARGSLVLESPSSCRSLLATVVSNEAKNLLRSRKSLKRTVVPRGLTFEPPVQLTRLELAEALESFPEELTPILTGMKYNELARSLNVPIGTIKSKLYRARLG